VAKLRGDVLLRIIPAAESMLQQMNVTANRFCTWWRRAKMLPPAAADASAFRGTPMSP